MLLSCMFGRGGSRSKQEGGGAAAAGARSREERSIRGIIRARRSIYGGEGVGGGGGSLQGWNMSWIEKQNAHTHSHNSSASLHLHPIPNVSLFPPACDVQFFRRKPSTAYGPKHVRCSLDQSDRRVTAFACPTSLARIVPLSARRSTSGLRHFAGRWVRRRWLCAHFHFGHSFRRQFPNKAT